MEKFKSAILAAQATSDRWEVQYCTSALLEGNQNLDGLQPFVSRLDALQDAWRLASCDPVVAEGYECAIHSVLVDIADKCVSLVLGDDAAQAAKDAADLAAAKQLAHRLGVAHTFCV